MSILDFFPRFRVKLVLGNVNCEGYLGMGKYLCRLGSTRVRLHHRLSSLCAVATSGPSNPPSGDPPPGSHVAQ